MEEYYVSGRLKRLSYNDLEVGKTYLFRYETIRKGVCFCIGEVLYFSYHFGFMVRVLTNDMIDRDWLRNGKVTHVWQNKKGPCSDAIFEVPEWML